VRRSDNCVPAERRIGMNSHEERADAELLGDHFLKLVSAFIGFCIAKNNHNLHKLVGKFPTIVAEQRSAQ
jgi:hypothetical protein